MSKRFFKSTKESPYHLSVGAVLCNDDGKVACHHFDEFFTTDEHKRYEDFYILMRETVEPDESLEQAVLRGVKEEFGSTGEVSRFIGTLVTRFPREEVWIEKTTVYFLVRLKDWDITERSSADQESTSIIEWQSIDFLVSKMKEQGVRYKRTDFDESEILKRAKRYI